MPLFPQHVNDQLRHAGLIFHHQDSSAAHRSRIACEFRCCRLAFIHGNFHYGQLHYEPRAAAVLVFKRHFPAVSLHDSVNNRKTQARAYSRRLGGEERIEDSRRDSPRNARAVVGYFHSTPMTVSHPRLDFHFSLPALLQQCLFRVCQ
jgi:hypothetical protein